MLIKKFTRKANVHKRNRRSLAQPAVANTRQSIEAITVTVRRNAERTPTASMIKLSESVRFAEKFFRRTSTKIQNAVQKNVRANFTEIKKREFVRRAAKRFRRARQAVASIVQSNVLPNQCEKAIRDNVFVAERSLRLLSTVRKNFVHANAFITVDINAKLKLARFAEKFSSRSHVQKEFFVRVNATLSQNAENNFC